MSHHCQRAPKWIILISGERKYVSSSPRLEDEEQLTSCLVALFDSCGFDAFLVDVLCNFYRKFTVN